MIPVTDSFVDRAVGFTVGLKWGSAIGPVSMPFFPSVLPKLNDLSVTLDSGGVGSYSLSFESWNTTNQELDTATNAGLALDNRLTITLGNLDGSADMITGPITHSSLSFSQGGASYSVTGYDLRHVLRKGRYVRTFAGQNELDIAKSVIEQRGLKVSVDMGMAAAGPPAIEVLDQDCTLSDYEFVKKMLDRVGFELAVEGETLIIREPVEKPLNPFDLAFLHPTNLLSFSGSTNTAEAVDGVIVLSKDPTTKAKVEAAVGSTVAVPGLAPPTVLTMRRPKCTAAAAKTIATEEMERRAAKVTATCSTLGDPTLVPGRWVTINDIGPYDGSYRITSATHKWSASSGYTTDLTIELEG